MIALAPAEPMRVSVIIPTYNRAALLSEALSSVLAQGPIVTQIIVVDDGSTDGTADVVRGFGEPRIQYLKQAQSGPAVARDNGLKAAMGTHVAFLDSDDALEPQALVKLSAAAAAHPERVPFGRVSVHAETFLTPPHYSFAIAERSGRLFPELAFYDQGTIFAALYPKGLLERVGGFAASSGRVECEDYDLALRLALHTEFTYLPESVYRVRMHGGNRHRTKLREIWACQCDSAARHLERPGTRLLRRRVMAYFQGRIAGSLLEEGLRPAAARHYATCLALWPVKLGAWRGLVQCLASRPGGAT
jgi:glycosyltransferase involved in cell wall biosynthesis